MQRPLTAHCRGDAQADEEKSAPIGLPPPSEIESRGDHCAEESSRDDDHEFAQIIMRASGRNDPRNGKKRERQREPKGSAHTTGG